MYQLQSPDHCREPAYWYCPTHRKQVVPELSPDVNLPNNDPMTVLGLPINIEQLSPDPYVTIWRGLAPPNAGCWQVSCRTGGNRPCSSCGKNPWEWTAGLPVGRTVGASEALVAPGNVARLATTGCLTAVSALLETDDGQVPSVGLLDATTFSSLKAWVGGPEVTGPTFCCQLLQQNCTAPVPFLLLPFWPGC